MEVVNMPDLFTEIQKKNGVGVKDNPKYGFIVNVLSDIWDDNSMREDTTKFTKVNAKRIMIKLYDLYNDNESENEALDEGEMRKLFKKHANAILEDL